jgi:NTE family protein
MTRILVLGGGGAVGVAWEAAILAGMLEGGFDARDADAVIGTSAGSIVGSWVAHGDDLAQRARERGDTSSERRPPPMPTDVTAIGELFRLWGSFDDMTPERSAQVGALALKAPTASEGEMLASFSGETDAWPDKPLLILAVDCESGEHRVFTAKDGVSINVARAASCSVPGLFPPITIDGHRYTDGGVRSWTSADLALSLQPERVLIVAPAGVEGQAGVRGLAARQVAREMQQLQSAGVPARLVTFDDVALRAGQNLMDPASAVAAADAGLAHGRRIAAELQAWWDGAAGGAQAAL